MEFNHCRHCPTRRLCLAADLEDDAIGMLSRCVLPSAPMNRGDMLYRAGDCASHCFVVRSGAYKTFVLSSDGEEHITGFHFPGELIGLSGQAGGVYRNSASALETSTACRVPVDDMPTLWQIGSGRSLLRLMGFREQLGAEDHMNLSRPAADARVAGFLVTLGRRMKRQGRSEYSLPLPMSRTDLANHLGMTLECLSRVLARFVRSGLITASRTRITQDQPSTLEALAGHLDP
jgi:CRP/FNR family transcriptional regulator